MSSEKSLFSKIIFRVHPEFAVFGYDKTVRARKRTAPRYSRQTAIVLLALSINWTKKPHPEGCGQRFSRDYSWIGTG
jgi:hypothetical protein